MGLSLPEYSQALTAADRLQRTLLSASMTGGLLPEKTAPVVIEELRRCVHHIQGFINSADDRLEAAADPSIGALDAKGCG